MSTAAKPFEKSRIEHEGSTFISVFIPGQKPLPATDSHPNFKRIDAKLKELDAKQPSRVTKTDLADLAALFDVSEYVKRQFTRLTERIAVRAGVLTLDGDPLPEGINKLLLGILDSDADSIGPWTKFVENLYTNPQTHSRNALFEFITRRNFTITDDGCFVGYKGVQKKSDGTLVSVHSGQALVDGKEHKGQIPNPIGAVVEMPRKAIDGRETTACHEGLHVGTFEYASGFAQGALLEVHVNPRDVVAVPEYGWDKIRCCRYKVVGHIEREYAGAYRKPDVDGVTTNLNAEQPSAPDPTGVLTGDVPPTVPAKASTKKSTTTKEKTKTDKEKPVALTATQKSKINPRLYPKPTDFAEMRTRAKTRKQNFAKYAAKQGPWVLLGNDPTNRKHWNVVK